MDVNRGRIRISKCTYQNRYRKDIILLRLDIDGPEHTNPDGEILGSPHLHIYREGYHDKWAFPLPSDFSDDMELFTKFFEFLVWCNIDNVDELSLEGEILC